MTAIECEVLTEQRYTAKDLHLETCIRTGLEIPESTFRFRRKKAGLKTANDRRYGDEELNFMCKLSYWKAMYPRRTIHEFKTIWKKTQK